MVLISVALASMALHSMKACMAASSCPLVSMQGRQSSQKCSVILQVDVADVYRQGAPVRAEPLPGTGSFLQEEIQKQRELHTTAHFLQTAAAINQLAQTLPLIVHHKVHAPCSS